MRKGYRRVSRGSVFLLAMVALVCLLLLGTSLVQVAIHGLSFASTQQKRAQALTLAESGVEMVCERIYEGYGAHAPYSTPTEELNATGAYADSFSLGDGTVSYVVTQPVPGIARSLEIRSTGITRTNKRDTVRVVGTFVDDVDRVFRGAIFCDSDLDLKGGGAVYPNADNEGGDIYAKGVINFDTQSAFDMSPYGSIYTATPAPGGITGAVPAEVPASNVHEGIAPLPMPAIDLNYYREKVLGGGGTYYTPGKQGERFTNPDFSTSGGLIFVEGDVHISGTYTGSAAIVATGTIYIEGNGIKQASPTDSVALISTRGVKITGGGTVDGLIYSHGVEVQQSGASAGGGITINGAIVADVVTCHGSMEVHYDDVWMGLDIPGAHSAHQINQISWEELPE